MRDVAILTRMYNSSGRVEHAIKQMSQLGDKVTWRIQCSKGTDNTREALEEWLAVWADDSDRVKVIVTEEPCINAQEAICRLFEQAEEDDLYIFDDDNWLVPNRTSLHTAACQLPRGICAVRTIGIQDGEPSRFYPMNTNGMDVIIDAGAMRIRRDYAQKRLVPATRKAMRSGNGPSLYEDRFWTALAIKDHELCTHKYPLHLYRFRRQDGQMTKIDKREQEELFAWTSQKILEELEGRLSDDETKEVLAARLME